MLSKPITIYTQTILISVEDLKDTAATFNFKFCSIENGKNTKISTNYSDFNWYYSISKLETSIKSTKVNIVTIENANSGKLTVKNLEVDTPYILRMFAVKKNNTGRTAETNFLFTINCIIDICILCAIK